jgi:RNA polymerase sigma-70 factor (ECF subfamily)
VTTALARRRVSHSRHLRFWQGEGMTSAIADEFETHRPRLFGLAYRMLSSAEEAEDTVQDAYLRFSGADRGSIEYPAAWLAKVVTNLCLTS